MTEKNIFVYKLFLLYISISDFSFFFCKNCNPPPPPPPLKKVTSLFSSNPLSKFRSCQTPATFFLKKSACQIWHETCCKQLVEKHFMESLKFVNNFKKFIEFGSNFIKFVELASNFTKFVRLARNFYEVRRSCEQCYKVHGTSQ